MNRDYSRRRLAVNWSKTSEVSQTSEVSGDKNSPLEVLLPMGRSFKQSDRDTLCFCHSEILCWRSVRDTVGLPVKMAE